METTWREWEFELGPAAPGDADARAALLAAATGIALAAGVGFTVAGGAVFAWWPGKTTVAVSGTSVAVGGEF